MFIFTDLELMLCMYISFESAILRNSEFVTPLINTYITMKLHLPVSLFRAVLLVMTAVPAALYAEYTAPTEIVVPDSYTNSVEICGTADISTQTADTVYRLTDDVTISPNGVSLSTVSYLYTSDSADNLADLSFTRPSGSTAKAFTVSGSQVTFDSLNAINFSSFNTTGVLGGAISVTGTGNLIFSDNAEISFSSNKVAQKAPMNAANGGAVSIEGAASFVNNGDITFSNNEAQSQGGAIALDEKRTPTEDTHLVIKGNGDITFSGNKTSNQLAGLGGAMYNILGNIEMTHNGDVTFDGNSARATYMAQGGAIYCTANGASGLTLNLSYNESLSFTSNLSQSGNYNATDGNAYGGAILASGTDISLNNNGSLLFKDNQAYTTKSNWIAQGGAIRVGYDGSLSIQNNGTAIFENNTTKIGSTVKYNSIYADDFSVNYRGDVTTYELDVNISAPEDGSVEFRDCVHVDVSHHEDSSFNLNSEFKDEKGNSIAQTGDIIFTGSYMTSGDKTSTFVGLATLNDGSLIIKDEAVLKAGQLAIAESASGESSPTLSVQNATLAVDELTFADKTTLECTGVDNSTAAQISVAESLTLGDTMNVILGLSGSYSGDTMKVAIAEYTGSESSWYTLPDDTAFTVNSLLWNASELSWAVEDNVLYVQGSMKQKEEIVLVDQEIVLDDEAALGDAPITTDGDTKISTKDDVVVSLPSAIDNHGDLTMEGRYDGSSLDEVNVAATRICVDGEEGDNGFYREGGTALIVVDNEEGATLTVGDETYVTDKNGDELTLYASGLAAGALDYSNYHIETADHTVAMSDILDSVPEDSEDPTITMNDGTLIADADVETLQAKGGTVEATGDVEINGELSGATSVQVNGGQVLLDGNNSHTGDTVIEGEDSVLTVAGDKALGRSLVRMRSGATLDLQNQAVGNDIVADDSTLRNADGYDGSIALIGELELDGNATAGKLTLRDSGTLTAKNGETFTTKSVEIAAGATGAVDAPLATTDGGVIILNDGSMLNVSGSLTLGKGTTFRLNGSGYNKGSVLATATDGVNETSGRVDLSYGYGTYTAVDGEVILNAIFNQNYANACTVSNWGIATASRAFVSTVRGQHSNMGCIADGRGTVWTAVISGSHDISDSDISLLGAAVGADMKIGKTGRMGIALGYIEGDASPNGLRKVEQEGSYLALYGEHGLKQLSPTTGLSLDWVAAYGTTESNAHGLSWEQDSVQINARLSWNKAVNNRTTVSAFGGLEYFANESDTVNGVKTGSIQNLRGEIGVGVRYVPGGMITPAAAKRGLAHPACERLVLHGELRYMNDMVRSNPVTRMDGLSGYGEANPGRYGFGIEAGATYRINDRWSASANYEYYNMNDSREHRVNVGASYTF